MLIQRTSFVTKNINCKQLLRLYDSYNYDTTIVALVEKNYIIISNVFACSIHPSFYFATHSPALQTWAAEQHEVPSILTQAVVPASGQASGSGVLFTHWLSPHVWSAAQHKSPVEVWQTTGVVAPAGALQKLFATQIPLLHFSSAVQQSAPSMLLQSVVPKSQVFVGSGFLSTH